MKKLLILLLASLSLVSCGSDDENGNETSTANANANGSGFISRLEFPRVAGGNTKVITHTDSKTGEVNYSVEFNVGKQSQHWTCYEMYQSIMNNGGVTRYFSKENQYPQDPDQYVADRIYGSGYDHGHICPSADRLKTEEMNYQTFYLTNMQPQVNPFNAGIWADGEAKLRNLSRNTSKVDTIYVCKGGTIGQGGTLANQVLTTTSKGMIVPRYFFVAMLSVKNGVYSSMGVLYDQKQNGTYNGEPTYPAPQCMSIDNLEALTGFDFFCNLPDAREKVIENHFSASMWGY